MRPRERSTTPSPTTTQAVPSVDPESLARIDRAYVHKYQQRNVIVARVDRVDGREDFFEAELTPDWTHPLFFDHPCDHVPSMMLVEAGRQMILALSHIHLGVPLGVAFVIHSLEIAFSDFADIDSPHPVLMRAELRDRVHRQGRLISLVVDGTFHQGARQVGRIVGKGLLLPRKTYDRLRHGRLRGIPK
jgi:hypothetical protein